LACAVLLLSCSAPPPPALTISTDVASMEHAESVPVARFLAPTALGAATDVLCPWARGEVVPDASLGRWMAEQRLAWRTVTVHEEGGHGPYDPAVGAAAKLFVASAEALETRCGTSVARDVLVTVGPEVSTRRVYAVLAEATHAGLVPWMLVADPTPDAAPVPPRPGDAIALGVTAAGETFRYFPDLNVDAITGDLDSPALAPALAQAGCATVAIDENVPWQRHMALMDALYARRVPLWYTGVILGAAFTVKPTTAAIAEHVTTEPLHGTVAAWRLPTPRYCEPAEATPCGCKALQP
jgi:hypothetical protein